VSTDPRWGPATRFHLHESVVQKAVVHAARQAAIAKRVGRGPAPGRFSTFGDTQRVAVRLLVPPSERDDQTVVDLLFADFELRHGHLVPFGPSQLPKSHCPPCGRSRARACSVACHLVDPVISHFVQGLESRRREGIAGKIEPLVEVVVPRWRRVRSNLFEVPAQFVQGLGSHGRQ
jgi:hypothetical protein